MGGARIILGALSKLKGTRLVALCDVDHTVLGKEMQKANAGGDQVEGYTDIRKLRGFAPDAVNAGSRLEGESKN